VLPLWDWRFIGLVPAILLNSLPFHQALNHGQNTFTSLLLLTITVTFWLKSTKSTDSLAPIFAGLTCGLLFYKPQLGAAVAIVLILHLGWRALLGVGVTSIILLCITLLTMPGIIHVYLDKMPGNLAWMQDGNSYLWERHVTLKAFWRLMLQGHAIGPSTTTVKTLWFLSTLGLAAALSTAIYKTLKSIRESAHTSTMHASRLISATIVCMPLLMPFYFDYDLLLLAVAAVLFAAEIISRRGAMVEEDTWLVWAWVALFVIMFFNASVSGIIRLHLAVIPLCAVALLHIHRACRVNDIAIAGTIEQPAASIAA
jgi:hypothetical protein